MAETENRVKEIKAFSRLKRNLHKQNTAAFNKY